MRRLLENERSRLIGLERARTLADKQVDQATALEAVLLILAEAKDSTDERTYGSFQPLTSSEARKMSSQLYKSFVTSAARKNPVVAVEKLFSAYSLQRVFATPLFCRMVTESAKTDRTLLARYITPNVGEIMKGTDSVKLHFAPFFEQVGDTNRAMQLLSLVQDQETFNFHNIMANCVARSDLAASEYHNERALSLAFRPRQRARVLTNMATNIYSHKVRDRFEEAKRLCEKAIALRQSSKFHWPSDLLLVLSAEMAKWEELETEVEALCSRLRIGRRAAQRAIQKIADPARRRAMNRYFHRVHHPRDRSGSARAVKEIGIGTMLT